MRSRLLLVVAALALGLIPHAHASTPSASTVSTTTTSTWIGGPFASSSPGLSAECVEGTPTCDVHKLTVVPAIGSSSLTIKLQSAVPTDDYDLYVYKDGVLVGSDGAPPGIQEEVVIDSPVGGVYDVKVLAFLVAPGSTYTATATLSGSGSGGTVDTTPGTVIWNYDRDAAQAVVDVPLRVVMVGFRPEDNIDASKLIGEIPDAQRPGVLIRRGSETVQSGDSFPLFGAEELINHGRNYFNDAKPFTVPYEYRWKRQVIYAPEAFTNGLFAAMRANSTTGDFSNVRNREFLERYNASRGAYRGVLSAVPPAAPVRFVDGEKVEDWIAANTQTYLGFDMPARGKGGGTNPGYTVFILNTWDSAAAKSLLQPDHEYHVFRINRTDPDTGGFDGIDWARVWGGRYRFMMVDTGAAPNPYEAETWGNRNRSPFWGSANYDPPLWEFRANAPRPVDLVAPQTTGIEQAVTPGASWNMDELGNVLGRTVNQATSFRFLHSYLYEPWPGTGSYFLSDNVWHDAKAELPWASDLTKLYNQDVVKQGLRTLTPYLTFDGDVRFEYLAEPSADHTADQAMLDQAKEDGDDVAGVAHAGMHTDTAMDYLDSKPERFLRGTACSTIVPGISVVAEKHYAWALAIAAGIATNRNGYPWGYLNSVNDVFKSPHADRDETMRLTHQTTGTGAFTYTAVHEASHYLGLAHPHDSIGATRNPDGTPRYYGGFTWTFNSTAAPTTYSHTELVYSILDQESIARGHTAYYLSWADEALASAGEAYYAKGVKLVSDLPALARKLRDRAIDMSKKAEVLFTRFEFVNATFAAQRAWRAAAAYNDLANGLAPGSTEVEKGTRKEGASACASANEK